MNDVIRNDEELERLTAMLLELDGADNLSIEEEVLAALIEQYECEHHALPRSTPTELIQFLLEQRRQSAKDLWPVIGSKGNTSEILSGKRKIGVSTAAKLADFFHVPAELFVDWRK